ncbi:MAG TPA: adenylate kinase [Phycisphaerae bacterium]|nr:adenylate kinase [Phycisphaerae bacterium]HOI54049.1 adenylate kinase [Phycisphaerae bacterium]
MRIVLLGPPGAGKGTQAKDVSEKLSVPHISSGDIFRGEMNAGTELGKKLKEFVNAGQLVPDDLTTEIVVGRLSRDDCASGYLLDGFPRTLAQAESLDRELGAKGQKLRVALNLDIAAEKIADRMAGRRMCRQCGASYHLVTLRPKAEGVCDRCGGELYQRDDDKPETVKQRLDVYFRSTAPLVQYYQAKGILKQVNADGTPEEVRQRVFAALNV